LTKIIITSTKKQFTNHNLPRINFENDEAVHTFKDYTRCTRGISQDYFQNTIAVKHEMGIIPLFFIKHKNTNWKKFKYFQNIKSLTDLSRKM
jgi:hypothetical protein